MKKAALITIHSALNYGGALQTFATQYAIEKLGICCEIVDFQTKRCLSQNKIFVNPFSKVGMAHDLRNVVTLRIFLKRKKNFSIFSNTYFHLSDTLYTIDNISSFPQKNYDCFITGSDQTFNLNLYGEQNINEQKVYFWDFINSNQKISYAASIGEHLGDITDEQKHWIKQQLSKYKSISVREPVFAKYLKENMNIEAQSVIDPTFLLDASEWNKIAKSTKYENDDYILFYSVLSDVWVVDYVKKLSEKTGLKVIAAHPQNHFELKKNSFIRASFCGPAEFVSLVKNAKLVVSSSFHGMAFAVNFNKPLISIVLGEGNRIKALAKMCDIEEVVITKDTTNKDYSKAFSIDYSYANSQILAEREKGIAFLKKAMCVEE